MLAKDGEQVAEQQLVDTQTALTIKFVLGFLVVLLGNVDAVVSVSHDDNADVCQTSVEYLLEIDVVVDVEALDFVAIFEVNATVPNRNSSVDMR